MYLEPSKNHWICDIETDGLRDEATTVWVVCLEHVLTDEAQVFTDMETFKEWLNANPSAILVGHNFIAFDCPVLNKLVRTKIGVKRCVDTLVLSMLFSPSLAGGHSLDAWGQRIKMAKLEFNDWTHLSDEMIHYCQQDVKVNKRVYLKLIERMKQVGFTEKSAELEHLSWHIIQNKQKRRGFPFNLIEAEKLYSQLRLREEELKKEIYVHWPPRFECIRRFKKSHTIHGNPTKNYLRHLEQYPELRKTDDGGYDAFDWVEFGLGSPSQRVAKLLELGWKPVKFTKVTPKGGGGNPQVDEDSLIAFAEESGKPEVRALATWIVTNSRANMIRTWLNAYNEKTGALHGNLWLANTLRYRHDNPNTANIPAVRFDKSGAILRGEQGSWSYESRDLWWSGSPDYSLVGIDAKGIQLRILAEYLADEAFTEAILSDDPHTANQKAWGFPSRAVAKTIVYAILMGAGDKRVASEAKISLAEAKAAKELLFNRLPGLKKLIKRLQGELHRTGRITLCDGSRIMVSSDHMVIPYLLQGDESRIMRRAAIYVDEDVRKQKLDAIKVGDIHDEWQNLVRNDHIEPYTAVALGAFPRAGHAFNYRVPIEGDAKVGKTWAETH